jgi:hypothetical protein
MASPTPCSAAATATPHAFLPSLGYFLTPQVWKQALQATPRRRARRWQAQPLLFVLLATTWCAGDSLPERFETARAFYVALHQRRGHPATVGHGGIAFELRRVVVVALGHRQCQ